MTFTSSARKDITNPEVKSSTASRTVESWDAPYQALSKAILFQNTDQHRYWHRVAPMFCRMLSDGKYNIDLQYRYLCLYSQLVVPSLGPFTTSGNDSDFYKCTLGGYGPVELSQNFQASGSTVRIAFEPTSHAASMGADICNRQAVHVFLSNLKLLDASAVNLYLHHSLNNQLTLTDAEEEQLTPEDLAKFEVRTQNLIALDFTKSGIIAKEYFLPIVKSLVTGQSVARICLDAVRNSTSDPSLSNLCQLIEDHIEQSETPAAFLACDLVDPSATRYKVYIHDSDVVLSRAENHWTLGGKLQGDDIARGLEIFRELWMGLGIIEGRRNPPGTSAKHGDPSSLLPLMYNYEMKPGDHSLKPQLYMPLTGIPEMQVASALTAFFDKHGMQDQARTFTENLKSYYTDCDLSNATRKQAWLSFSYTAQKGPYLSIYYHW
ncbi:putative dimethylallyl tryptophan synthase [Aspergillus udagawae]|uniref:Aromatic prenyltransferase n=1 Tax=Aspergillus udagawae TaxID=91492 RepID=A0A8H3SAT8_9EURO|nr:aromatic prenyltransferase [Aspergillus udagawae]GFF55211.1 putative dimethylallyl tryptophan synthase [Aspergillus udagawae]GIC91344.1 aromatic prenyltransferase [Aspergillus udagawae]